MQFLLLSHLAAGLAAPLLIGRLRRAAPWLLALVPLISSAALVATGLRHETGVLVQSWSWVPQLGAELSLRADGLSLLFTALIGLVGGLVVLHAGSYLAGNPQLGRFYFLLFLFMAAMFGLVLADNIWLLFACWELTSITSYFLIGFKSEKQYAREAARRALLTTGAGGLALLAGLIGLSLMGVRAGLDSLEAATISSLLEAGPRLTSDPAYPLVLILILAGAFTKSAQMPFHHWLPAAMAGPTPVSALLHSATMVKAGVYLLARLQPALGASDLWTALLVPVGAVTMLGGALLAIARTDLKEILAYTTLSALGTLVLLIGVGSSAALAAMVVFLTVHALYKSALFLVAANVDHRTGTRDLTRLSGLGRIMPWTGFAALLAALGQAGAPPALGYMGKKLALQAKLELGAYDEWLILAAVATNIAMVALALAVVVRPFGGSRESAPGDGRPVPVGMVAGPLVLGLLGVAVGLVPSAFDDHLGTAAATAAAGQPVVLDLKVWSGLSLQSLLLMGLSLGVFGAGYLLYRKLHLFHGRAHLPAPLHAITPTVLFDRGLGAFLRLAEHLTRRIQDGRLRRYVAAVAAAAGLGALLWLAPAALRQGAIPVDAIPAHGLLLVGIMVAGALGAAVSQHPIVAALCAGMTGLGLALVFALYSGVDLAITQLLVETLMIVILVAVLSRLPGGLSGPRLALRPLRLAVAALLGTAASLAVLLTAARDPGGVLSREILARAWPEAAGRNVVNVILVDFRALDTLGEVVVVAAAALAVAALVTVGRRVRS